MAWKVSESRNADGLRYNESFSKAGGLTQDPIRTANVP